MVHRYVAEISYGLSAQYGFAYIDTEDGLADFLFHHFKIDVEPDTVFHYEGDPYRIVMCKIPRDQREAFLNAIDLLPSLMDYVGKTDYESYCLEFFMNAGRWLSEHEEDERTTPLQ